MLHDAGVKRWFVVARNPDPAKGREAIFWQSARTVKASRPGVRIPSRRASGWPVLRLIVDSSERYAYKLSCQQAEIERRIAAEAET